MSYLQRRANRYEFRFRLPEDLAGKALPGPVPRELQFLVSADASRWKREIMRSLKTGELAVANRRVLPHIAELLDAVRLARSCKAGPVVAGLPIVSENVIDDLALQHERRILAGDENTRLLGVGIDPNAMRVASDGQGMSELDMHVYKFAIEFLAGEAREQAISMRVGPEVRARAEELIRCHKFSDVDPLVARQLQVALVRAEKRALESIRRRLDGEDVPTPQALPLQPTAAVKPSPPPDRSPDTLEVALDRWAAGGGRGVKRPRDRTKEEALTAVRLFTELHGKIDLQLITKAHARGFRDALSKLPKRLPDRLRGLPIREILDRELSALPVRSAQTVNKTLNLLSGIVARADKDGYFDGLAGWSNPFRVGLEIAVSERQPYEPFSAEELQKLFASPVFAKAARPLGGAGEAAYWFPLIALFSGARRTEIAQLRVGDIRQSPDGIPFIDINDEGDAQVLKNASSARSVPVHPELQRLGLLRYVDERRQVAGLDAALWPGFEPPLAAAAKSWSKWFGRYLGEHVSKSRAKTFHSFRHTFKRACREAGITEEVHHAFTGHAGGGVGRSYGRERREDGSLDRGISLIRLGEELRKVVYPSVSI